jgi:kynureninase
MPSGTLYVLFSCFLGVIFQILNLHDWNIDFACWCSYKYLNSGPGSISGVFVHARHRVSQLKRKLCGWWGQKPADRFDMLGGFRSLDGAGGLMLSNPPVLPTVCLLASLEIFVEAGMENLRAKSVELTGYLESLLDSEIGHRIKILTPRDKERRGCQLSLLLDCPAKPVQKILQADGIVCDVREPNVLRIAPCPLYNSFVDVARFIFSLKSALTR